MDNKQRISKDDLIGLVAGSLSESDFARVSLAVSKDVSLQNDVAALEMLRSRLAVKYEPALTSQDYQTAALRALSSLGISRQSNSDESFKSAKTTSKYIPTKHGGGQVWAPKKARWLYGAFAAQTLCLVWLAAGLLPSMQQNKPVMISAVDGGVQYRSAGAPAGQVLVVINFSPDASEKNIRSLLLGAGATIVDGPNQLGEYRLMVASHLADAALKKLSAAAFVESAKRLPAP